MDPITGYLLVFLFLFGLVVYGCYQATQNPLVKAAGKIGLGLWLRR